MLFRSDSANFRPQSFLRPKEIKEVLQMVKWKLKVLKAIKENDLYRPSFDSAIDILSSLLERRDVALKKFAESGDDPVVELANKSLATHPYLKQAEECERLALAYLKEMGLTASGYKKLKGNTKEGPKEFKLDDLRNTFKVG